MDKTLIDLLTAAVEAAKVERPKALPILYTVLGVLEGPEEHLDSFSEICTKLASEHFLPSLKK